MLIFEPCLFSKRRLLSREYGMWSLNSCKSGVFYLTENGENGYILSAIMRANLRLRSVNLRVRLRSSISFWFAQKSTLLDEYLTWEKSSMLDEIFFIV